MPTFYIGLTVRCGTHLRSNQVNSLWPRAMKRLLRIRSRRVASW
jgi:hypothetical protein